MIDMLLNPPKKTKKIDDREVANVHYQHASLAPVSPNEGVCLIYESDLHDLFTYRGKKHLVPNDLLFSSFDTKNRKLYNHVVLSAFVGD